MSLFSPGQSHLFVIGCSPINESLPDYTHYIRLYKAAIPVSSANSPSRPEISLDGKAVNLV
jgi:hypothetical protein